MALVYLFITCFFYKKPLHQLLFNETMKVLNTKNVELMYYVIRKKKYKKSVWAKVIKLEMDS